MRDSSLFASSSRALSASVAALLLSLPASAVTHKDWILVAPAGSFAQSLLTENKESDPLAQAARRAADDPYPDAGTLRLIQAAHVRDEQEWEQAFAADMGSAFREAADAVTVPFEYPPNADQIPDGFGVAEFLSNAVPRARLPCSSIYAVDSLSRGFHGWILVCDHKANAYGVFLAEGNWRLKRYPLADKQRRTPH
jgi:hypothetical protein